MQLGIKTANQARLKIKLDSATDFVKIAKTNSTPFTTTANFKPPQATESLKLKNFMADCSRILRSLSFLTKPL